MSHRGCYESYIIMKFQTPEQYTKRSFWLNSGGFPEGFVVSFANRGHQTEAEVFIWNDTDYGST